MLNIGNTPPLGHSFSPAQRLMGRRTLCTLPLSAELLKPQPPDPWIYGQVVDNISPSSCSVDTGDLVLRRNRTQLQPAAPPQNSLQQLPALPIPQPSLLGTPTISSDLSQRKLSQPPCHSPSSGMSALSAPSPPPHNAAATGARNKHSPSQCRLVNLNHASNYQIRKADQNAKEVWGL